MKQKQRNQRQDQGKDGGVKPDCSTVSFVRVVVESAVDGSVALQMFGDAETVVLANELVTAWSGFHLGPDGAEALATTHLIGSDERDHHLIAIGEMLLVFLFKVLAADFQRRLFGLLPYSQSGQAASSRFQLSFDGEGLQMQKNFVIGPRLNFPVAIVRPRTAIVFIRPSGTGEDAAGRPRRR